MNSTLVDIEPRTSNYIWIRRAKGFRQPQLHEMLFIPSFGRSDNFQRATQK